MDDLKAQIKQELTESIKLESDSASQDSNGSSTGYTRWAPNLDGVRKSAFLPYKPVQCTALTNLQRGNTQARVVEVLVPDTSFHSRAGRGEVSKNDITGEHHIDIKDEHGLSALHWAAYYGQINACKNLLWCGAEVDIRGPEGETPLHLAAAGGHHEIVKLLLAEGAQANVQDIVGNTALMYACAEDSPHTVMELLNKGADLTLTNEEMNNAYTIAMNNNSQLAQTVIENHLITYLSSPKLYQLMKNK